DAAAENDVAALLAPAELPGYLASVAVDAFGDDAALKLRTDPWVLLDLSGVRPAQADVFARSVLGAEARAHDVRRGRALVRYLLARSARDGHTVMPLATMHAALGGFEAGDPVAVVAAALEDGRVVAYDEDEIVAL